MSDDKEFDIVVYGASGFTGRLVAEYIADRHRDHRGALRWAMAGRDAGKLSEVRDLIGAPSDTPLVIADAADPEACKAMAASTRVVLTTVGPFQLYGSKLVEACVDQGADYVDLCGEPGWMREMIDRHQEAAERSGARIVFSCGYDSVPFDLGVYFLQEEAIRRHGKPAPRVKGRLRGMKGSPSGGTVASLLETARAGARDPVLAPILRSSFALTPGFEGPLQPSGGEVGYDPAVRSWNAPFIMAPINTKNVHRTNFLLGHPWGKDFVYDEMVMTGDGENGKAVAEAIASHDILGESRLRPGEGPGLEERETGFFDILFVGEYADGTSVRASVRGDRDPGYGSTSRMIAEAAIVLLASKGSGGIWTPGALLGTALIDRLSERAGIEFGIE